MPGISITIDERLMKRGVKNVNDGLSAMARSVQLSGRAEVITTKRTRLKFEGAAAKADARRRRSEHTAIRREARAGYVRDMQSRHGISRSRAGSLWRESGQARQLQAERSLIKARKQKTAHGAVIAAMLRKKGKDPFDYPVKLARRVSKFLSDEIGDSLEKANKTNRPQKQQIELALRAGAEELAEGAKKNIESGGLGRNTGKYAVRKKALIRRGYGVRKYGDNTVGIFTGRFLASIKHRWRKGHRPT